MGEPPHERLPYIRAEVIWSVHEQMARSVEAFFARRSRALLLDARASMDMVPEVAPIMANERGYDKVWQAAQVAAYTNLSAEFLPA